MQPRANKNTVKTPPHSLEAEQSVLGALMLDPRAWDRVSDRLKADDFYRPEHQHIYAALVRLAEKNQPFDVLMVTQALRDMNTLSEAGGEAYLFEIANSTPSAANIDAYVSLVLERSVLRQLINAGSDIVSKVYGRGDIAAQELLDEAERLVFNIADKNARGVGPQAIAELLPRTTEKIDLLYQSQGRLTGLSTGFSDFDRMTSGLQPGDLVIIAGRPSMGKTVFGMNIAEHAAIKEDKPTLVFSLEMPAEALMMRMMSSLGSIDQHKLRSGQLKDDDWPRITSAVSMLSEARMYIDDTPALSPQEVRARARRLARKYGGLKLIVLDYLQLMQIPGGRENRTTEISEISRALKTIAKELNVPFIALSQLNRSLEQRHDRRPVMSDLRESGAIEQDADIIAFIYRDEVYNEDSPDKGTAEIIIRKHRNGPIGDFRLTFRGQYLRFENFANEHAMPEVIR